MAPDGREARLGPSIGEYPIYDARSYSVLAGDDVRRAAFRSALASVAPGAHVLDLGCGGELLWARESVGFGAAAATAVEVMPSAAAQARATLAGLARTDPASASRITLLEGSSMGVALPERFDVCVAEIVGSFAGAEGIAAVVADARARLLRPDAVIVPRRAVSHIAAVDATTVMGGADLALDDVARRDVAAIFSSVGHEFDVRLRVTRPVGRLATTPAVAEDLHLATCAPVAGATTVRLDVLHDGRIDALLGWLGLTVADDRTEIDVLRDSTSWGALLFPFPCGAVHVRAGDALQVGFSAVLSDDGVHPDYRFTITHQRGSDCTELPAIVSEHHGRARGMTPLHREVLW